MKGMMLMMRRKMRNTMWMMRRMRRRMMTRVWRMRRRKMRMMGVLLCVVMGVWMCSLMCGFMCVLACVQACLEEMPQQVRNFQMFQNVDESGNLLVPTDKLDEMKRR